MRVSEYLVGFALGGLLCAALQMTLLGAAISAVALLAIGFVLDRAK